MANTPNQSSARQRRKGPRPKHVPQRMCISCREKGDKRGLVRIVRTPDQRVEIDPIGKRNGRGAYLCHLKGCWDGALTGSALARALNTELTEETRQELAKFAATLGGDAPDHTAAAS